MPVRPRLTPAIALTRRATREALAELKPKKLLLAVSGGADSLAMSAAVAFEARKLGIEVAAAVIDHALQANSAEVAAQAAERLATLGIDQVIVQRVVVKKSGDGMEACLLYTSPSPRDRG